MIFFCVCVFACLAKCTLKAGFSSLLTTQCKDFCLVAYRKGKDISVCFAEGTMALFFHCSTELIPVGRLCFYLSVRVKGNAVNNMSQKVGGLAASQVFGFWQRPWTILTDCLVVFSLSAHDDGCKDKAGEVLNFSLSQQIPQRHSTEQCVSVS